MSHAVTGGPRARRVASFACLPRRAEPGCAGEGPHLGGAQPALREGVTPPSGESGAPGCLSFSGSQPQVAVCRGRFGRSLSRECLHV